MSNCVNCRLDVLVANEEELDSVEAALQQPSPEFFVWASEHAGDDQPDFAARLKRLVGFTAITGNGSVGTYHHGRRFTNCFKGHFWYLVAHHLFAVSEQCPTAILLLEYFDDMESYSGKAVIHAGIEVRHVHDRDQQAQGRHWVLPDIFAPFWSEYELRLEFGSLWEQWVDGMLAAVERLKPAPSTLGRPGSE